MFVKQIKIKFNFSNFLKLSYSSVQEDILPKVKQYSNQNGLTNKYKNYLDFYKESIVTIGKKYLNPSEIDWMLLQNQIGIKPSTVSCSQQLPGTMLPLHKDVFNTIQSEMNISETIQIYRANIFMEDRKPGHFIEINNKIISDWTAGEGYIWDNDIEHISANAGSEPKYTLQVTGTLV